ENAAENLNDALSGIDKVRAEIGDVDELPAIDERLFALRDVARKHRTAIDALPELLEALRRKVELLDSEDDALNHLADAEQAAREAYAQAARDLSARRTTAAGTLAEAVAAELPDLKLNAARFVCAVSELPEAEWHAQGMNRAVFLVSTNRGVPPAPIQKVASGGELARFMLALKLNLARAERMETLVFDEVDTGISGATADAVGKRLRALARDVQVLVVTHAPQVAAYGAHHYAVSKTDGAAAVLTSVRRLSADERPEELARILAGGAATDTARKMARELMGKT
ncbi:MAG: DNA repair protein RecN, partial [Alphaproteobacteria bacterium]|nr:DNA repair protein RecN [Alphaproteobacteria bacterium]